MPPPSSQATSKARWFWVVVLLALLITVIFWFADPLGIVEGTPRPEPTANPTEWTVEPTGPAVEVRLPETPMTNSASDAAKAPSE